MKKTKTEIKELCFNAVDSDCVTKHINKINIKKATGKDGISSKILKLSESEVSYPISKLINKSFEFSVFFSNKLQEAHAIPLHKKSNTLDKGNNRPVSILPMISKHFERSIETQPEEFFSSHFHNFFVSFSQRIWISIFASQGLRFGSPFSPPLADLEYILNFARNATCAP